MLNVVLIGASGAVGKHVLDNLISNPNFKSITLISRNEIETSSVKVKQIVLNDFKEIEFLEDDKLNNIDVGFSLIGSNLKDLMNKDDSNLINIEYNYAVGFARLCSKNGVKSYTYISMSGASKNSKNKVSKYKGMVEDEILKLNFENTYILKPRFLNRLDKSTTLEKFINFFIPTVSVIELSNIIIYLILSKDIQKIYEYKKINELIKDIK